MHRFESLLDVDPFVGDHAVIQYDTQLTRYTVLQSSVYAGNSPTCEELRNH